MANPKDRAAAVARKLVRCFQEHDGMWAVTVAEALDSEVLVVFSPQKKDAVKSQRHYTRILTVALRKAGVR